MALTGIGSNIAASALAQQNMQNQLDVLSRQLGTGQKAAVYSELGSQAGLAVGLDSQLSAIDGYDNTNSTITTTLGIEEAALSQIGNVASAVQGAAVQPAGFTLSSNGQTALQANAASQLDQILGLLNTQVRQLSVSGAQPAVGRYHRSHPQRHGAAAGPKQVIPSATKPISAPAGSAGW